jgi:hypothetical protein
MKQTFELQQTPVMQRAFGRAQKADLSQSLKRISLVAVAILTGFGFGMSSGYAADQSTSECCPVTCHDPHPACSESARVIDTLNKLTQLINDGKFDAMGEYFDDGVTTFNEDTKKLIIGKDAVIADIKQRYEHQHKTDGHLLSYTIDSPYAEVTGNRAVVTFVAKKVLAGAHPVDMESHSTEVFVRDGDKWKTLHYRGAWKKVSS